jgi:hypothetical protein
MSASHTRFPSNPLYRNSLYPYLHNPHHSTGLARPISNFSPPAGSATTMSGSSQKETRLLTPEKSDEEGGKTCKSHAAPCVVVVSRGGGRKEGELGMGGSHSGSLLPLALRGLFGATLARYVDIIELDDARMDAAWPGDGESEGGEGRKARDERAFISPLARRGLSSLPDLPLLLECPLVYFGMASCHVHVESAYRTDCGSTPDGLDALRPLPFFSHSWFLAPFTSRSPSHC